ncbi:hypothetical protein Mth01_04480 [Sphaerimonospora thailandensis]|uniref:Uncharacterized protein n=1 Tax=Sphaerimonospora thailandensis TaxID=795644 RepID=A0A8J3VXS1_9ACTN|nr:hypothetical protein Mth01_04480 [Sphaerimonospora thailandensis]
MSGAATATRMKNRTMTADATPVLSRRNRRHISCPGERPTKAEAGCAGSAEPAVSAVASVPAGEGAGEGNVMGAVLPGWTVSESDAVRL